ncbi:AAA family ATPase [Angustibacter luteus]|uniref:AAA family ATPase n=1 Tax=Angustibacter luteus TaxID=658456 RepID=A0ABW1JGZ5_9ACTN
MTEPVVRAVLVTGAPGAGKSTVGAVLARRLSAALLDLDTATADLTAVVADQVGVRDLDDPRLAQLTRRARYEAIVSVAVENLRLGLSVVLVAPFTTERRHGAAWAALEARLRAAGGTPSLVWLDVDAPAVAERLRRRGADRDAWKAERAPGAVAVDLAPPDVPHLRADAARSPGEIAEAIQQMLP